MCFNLVVCKKPRIKRCCLLLKIKLQNEIDSDITIKKDIKNTVSREQNEAESINVLKRVILWKFMKKMML